MAKSKTVYVCQNCGAESAKWLGKCNSCNEWNTIVEEIAVKEKTNLTSSSFHSQNFPKQIHQITAENYQRIDTKINELNRILGGGLVPGSMVLIGGDPGIGKSTLALQVALKATHLKVLYISGEESDQQIKLRAERIGLKNENCFIYCETLLENIIYQIESTKPNIVIIDSIQTLYKDAIESSPGSVSQIKECTASLLKTAKQSSIPIFLIGHINKEGGIAGPKVLEHIVDTVLQFEGDLNHMYRILRVNKNRFGATSELAIFEMHDKGLKEVTNPSEILINQTDEDFSGIAISATIDGLRPFLIEIQALVSTAVYGTPQRSSTGFESRRLNMLLAVLEKKAGFKLGTKDVFLNIAGGIKVNDPAIDLAVVVAILSSTADISVNKKYSFSAEVGLSGEIRPVNRIIQRIKEAEKLGFDKIFISKYNKKNINSTDFKIQIIFVTKIEELLRNLFA